MRTLILLLVLVSMYERASVVAARQTLAEPDGLCRSMPVSGESQLASTASLVRSLTLEFIDQASSLPTEVRVGVFDSQGAAVAPVPAADFLFQNINGSSYFYCDGNMVINVPDGAVTIRAGKGFEYLPVELQMTVSSDTAATLTLSRWIDMPAAGWFSGDTHTHMTHPPVNYVVDPTDMLLMMNAEDLHFANIMEDDTTHFIGGPDPLSLPDRILYFSKEYRNSYLGHLSFLGLKQWFPTVTCAPQNVVCAARLNSDIAAEVHSQNNALIIATHPYSTTNFFETSPWPGGGVYRTLPMDVINNSLDAMDLLCYTHIFPPQGVEDYTRILNTGARLAASAGTDAILSSGASRPPGGFRVYVEAPSLTADNWIAGFGSGASFVTNYPLVENFDVDGVGAGSVVQTQQTTLSGNVTVRCAVPMERVDIIAEGQVIHTLLASGDSLTISGSFSVAADSSRWVVARATGSHSSWHNVDASGLFAQTSPVYIERTTNPPTFLHPATITAAQAAVARLDELALLYDLNGFFADSLVEAAFDSALTASLVYYHALAPDPPQPFELIQPMFWSSSHNDFVVSTLTPRFSWGEAVDPDPGSQVRYTLSYGTDITFATATVVPDLVARTYVVPGSSPLTNLSQYHWKVEASDETAAMTPSLPVQSSFTVDVTVTGVGPRITGGKWELGAARPNPFNPVVHLDYSVPDRAGNYTINVFDARGMHVRTLFHGERSAGQYIVRWNGEDDAGSSVATGIYFVRLTPAGGAALTQKVVLLK